MGKRWEKEYEDFEIDETPESVVMREALMKVLPPIPGYHLDATFTFSVWVPDNFREVLAKDKEVEIRCAVVIWPPNMRREIEHLVQEFCRDELGHD